MMLDAANKLLRIIFPTVLIEKMWSVQQNKSAYKFDYVSSNLDLANIGLYCRGLTFAVCCLESSTIILTNDSNLVISSLQNADKEISGESPEEDD